MRCVALFRGINVGGHNKMAMSAIIDILESLGLSSVETYLQSGNALFTVSHENVHAVAPAIEMRIAEEMGLEVPVLIRTADEMRRVVSDNPYPHVADNPANVHVSFLSASPEAARVATLDAARFLPEEFRLGDRCIYLWYPNGAGRARLTSAILERRLDVVATARNWKTVTNLVSLLADSPSETSQG